MSDDLVKMCRRLSKYAHAQLSATDLKRIADRIEELTQAFYNLHREYEKRGDRIEELEAKLSKSEALLAKAVMALERIASGEFSGRMLTSMPPQDAAQYFARSVLAGLNYDERSGVATVSEAESEKKGETDGR
jgi:hypothetical protein